MNIEAKKSCVKINEVMAGCGSEVLAETDVILSDLYPDILRVLQIDGNTTIKEKEVGSDRVILRGEVELTIIYVPDPQMTDLPAKSIRATAGFTDVCEVKGISADMKIRAVANISNIDYSLVNSRKLNIKTTVATEIKAYRQGETEFISDLEGDVPIETLQAQALAFRQEADDDFVITVADKLEIPTGKPAAAEILKVDAAVSGNDVKLIAGKAIIKGSVRISTLYIGQNDLKIEFMEHEIPFTEILDLPGVTEEMDCDIEYGVQSVYYETDSDDEGARLIGAEVTLLVNAGVTCRDSAILLSDCYCQECEIGLIRKVCSIDHIAAFLKPQILIKGTVELEEDCPGIVQIYNVVAKAFIESVDVDDGKATVTGVLKAYILYLTNDEERPIHSFRGDIPFTQSVEVEGASEVSVECIAHLLNCGFNLAADNSINIRANVLLSLKLIKSEKVTVVEDIKVSDAQEQKRAAIVIYFVQKGDSLWSIAKKYKTTVDKIAQTNNIDQGQSLQIGTKLLIP